MLNNRTTRAILAACILLASAPGIKGLAAASAPSAPPAISPPGSIANVMSVNPSTTVRGSNVQIFVQGAPPSAAGVSVQVDGRPVPTVVPDPKNPGAITATIPSTTEATAPDFVSLGTHSVSVLFDQQWFAAGSTLTVVRREQTSPVLRQAEPFEFTPRQTGRRMVLTGSGFLTDPAADNQVVIDGAALPVVWDQCDRPPDWAKSTAGLPHGMVNSSGTAIVVCNFALPPKPSAEVAIHQGNLLTGVQVLRIPPWPKAAIVLMSVGVNLACAASVLFLAWFVRVARIGNQRYGMFRILFLDPETNTYSLSKYQFYMWTGAAIFTYAYLAISRIFVQELSLPDIPSTLPAIIGLGAGTSIGAQLITSVRGPKGGGPEKPNLGDFITSGGVAAPERVQMFVWTTVGVIGFCLATLRSNPWDITGLPQVGTGLLYLMGLSSAGYLGGKLVRKPGPVISEISTSTAAVDGGAGGAAAGAEPAPARPNLSQPIAAAQAVLNQAQASLSGLAAASSTAALKACRDTVEALRLAIHAAVASDQNTLEQTTAQASEADLAARTAADVFSNDLASSATGAPADDLRQLAEIAERCASAAQDLATGVAQGAGSAQAAAAVIALSNAGASPARSINLRGRNLSTDAAFEINNVELPFRMLALVNGVRTPKMVAPEDDANASNMARELRLTIEPEILGKADRSNYDAWFSKSAAALTFSITNPDGQRSEISFTVPPGVHQANG